MKQACTARNEDSIDTFFRNIRYPPIYTLVCRCFVSIQHVGRERGISRRIYNRANERNTVHRTTYDSVAMFRTGFRPRRLIFYRLSDYCQTGLWKYLRALARRRFITYKRMDK